MWSALLYGMGRYGWLRVYMRHKKRLRIRDIAVWALFDLCSKYINLQSLLHILLLLLYIFFLLPDIRWRPKRTGVFIIARRRTFIFVSMSVAFILIEIINRVGTLKFFHQN
jgi:hypothetical protein